MAQETFLNLINQSMQESARLVRSSLGRSSYATTREKALQQVAMLQAAKDAQENEAIMKAIDNNWDFINEQIDKTFAGQKTISKKLK